MKEYCNLPNKTIPKFLSQFYLLEHSLNEVGIIWKDREKFKERPKYFINVLEELYGVPLEATKNGNHILNLNANQQMKNYMEK